MTDNKTIRVCVIDDEPIACRRLQRMLKEDPEIEVVKVCRNGEEASEAILQMEPELVFLDVQMPGMDGFEVLDSIKNMEAIPHVIFVTAYDQYAIRAFEVQALDYLLKPFDRKRFTGAVSRAKSQVRKERDKTMDRALYASLLNEIRSQPKTVDRLMIKSGGKVFFLKKDEIDWIQAHGKYASIHAGTESHLIREGMIELEQELEPTRFLRIHKSTIVNIDRIEHLQPLLHGDYRVFLRDGTVLTVSRRYRQKLDELFGKPL